MDGGLALEYPRVTEHQLSPELINKALTKGWTSLSSSPPGAKKDSDLLLTGSN